MSLSIKLMIKAMLNKSISLFNSPYRKVGIGFYREKIMKHTRNNELKWINIKKHKTWYRNDEEMLHSIKELFYDEVYKFKSSEKEVNIIDCGSHIGMSILYFKTLFPNSNILGFEPDVNNYNLLQKNLQEWNFNSITVEQAAVWTKKGKVNFSQTGSMSSGISDLSSGNDSQTNSIRLKDILENRIDFLKIDIEGAEYEVLVDCRDNLKFVRNIFIEYHGKFNDENKILTILDILTKNNFSFYIKEADEVYKNPFYRIKTDLPYDVQLNIFAFKKDIES